MKKYIAGDKGFLVMSREQVRAFDAYAIGELGIPGVVLMENAGRSCAELIIDRLAGVEDSAVCIFCGIGNNGGDGYVIARHLVNAGVGARVVICGDRTKIKGDALINLGIVEEMKVPILVVDMAGGGIVEKVKEFSADTDMIVDALFGTGLKGELRSNYAELITCINAQGKPILAVDIPSGLDCDAGVPLPVCIEAMATVTFVAAKKGFAECRDSVKATGEIFVASIGIDPKQ